MEDIDAECDVCGADPQTGRPREAPIEELDRPEGFFDDEGYDPFVQDDEALGGEGSETTPESRWGCFLTVLFILAVGALIAWLVSPRPGGS